MRGEVKIDGGTFAALFPPELAGYCLDQKLINRVTIDRRDRERQRVTILPGIKKLIPASTDFPAIHQKAAV